MIHAMVYSRIFFYAYDDRAYSLHAFFLDAFVYVLTWNGFQGKGDNDTHYVHGLR